MTIPASAHSGVVQTSMFSFLTLTKPGKKLANNIIHIVSIHKQKRRRGRGA